VRTKGAGLPIIIGVSRPSVLYKPSGIEGNFNLTRPRRHYPYNDV